MKPHIAKTIDAINWASAQPEGPAVVAVDLPSGLNCDSGVPSSSTIRATETVTFVAPKLGFTAPAAREFLGIVKVVSIGAPPEIAERAAKMGVGTMSEKLEPETNRKTFVDYLIEKAAVDGAFNNLPGIGKPLSELEEPYDELWWAKKLIEREMLTKLFRENELIAKV